MAIRAHPDCKPHPFQDQTYGNKMRVMNPTAKNGGYRCTVCGKDVGAGADTPKRK